MIHAVVVEKENAGIDTVVKHDNHFIPDACEKEKSFPGKECLECFSERNRNILFSDVQLAEEFSFDILNKTNIHLPVVFIVPENNFMMKFIGIKSLDFLSLSGENEESQKSNRRINKFRKLFLANTDEKRKKTRLLVKNGVANIPILLKEIAAIYIKNKLVFVVDHNSKKYSIDKPLTELEEELDKSVFFRANRQCLININFVKSFKTYQKVKLIVELDVPVMEEPIIISQLVAPEFKKWIEDA